MIRVRAAAPWITASVLSGLACWTWPTLYTLAAVAAAGVAFGVAHGLSTGDRTTEHLTRGPVTTNDAATGTPASTGTERCCVCGGPDTPYENYRGQVFCWPCANCGCVQDVCVRTGINDPALSGPAAIRTATEPLPGTPAVACAGCPGCGGPDCAHRPDMQQPVETEADLWHATAGIFLRHVEQAETTLARARRAVAAAISCGEDGLCPVCADGGGHLNAIKTALAPVDELGLAVPDVVHPGTEQPVNGAQLVDESAAGGGPVAQTVPLDWTGAGRTFTALLRKHPTAFPDIIRDANGNPICTCTYSEKCPACLAEEEPHTS